MTDLTPNHPAVEALADAIYRALSGQYGDFGTPSKGEAHAALTAALPHLTADDLRNTDAAEEIRTEGWLQGWAAGRDLDGDEDAIPYLRNTSAGRALMAEAWERGLDRGYSDGLSYAETMPPNPYRQDNT